jgi:alpha-L-arabinofuranosidase
MSRIQVKGSRPLRREFGCVLAGCLQPIQNGFRVLHRTTQELLESRLRLALVSLALPLTVATLHAQLPNPVGYIPFDEGTGATAHDAAGSNNATLMGGAGWTTGIVGPFALSLPGTSGSYADIPADVVSTTKSFTVCAWVNFTNVSGYQTFVSEDAGYQSAFFLQKRADSNTFTFTMNTGATSGPGTTVFADSGITPAAGTWYHVTGVYDAGSGSLSVYVNGALAGQNFAVSPSPAVGHTGIGHGQYNNGYTDWVNGAIDDVRFYSGVLSAADILAIARIGNPNLPGPQPLQPASLSIDASQPGLAVNPLFYGLMIEEINHGLDGGLYGELIQNRVLKNDPNTPVAWSAVQGSGGAGSIALDLTQPVVGTELTTSLKVAVTSSGSKVGAANSGYWGIPVTPSTKYSASVWAKGAPGFTGPLTVDIESSDGSTIYAQTQIPKVTANWKKYSVTLKTALAPTTSDAQFVISTTGQGTFWITQASLFKPTYNNRPNGNRVDLMQTLAAMKPAHLRLPGGNYLEGNTIAERFEWTNTIGPIEQRPGHPSPWGYFSDDGLGLLEYLEWCEDLNMQPVLAVYAGYSLDGEHVNPGADLAPYVQDAVNEIEYATGGTNTFWGAQRAADGHPQPFRIQYVEIGNEDFFDGSGSYDGRFAQFYDAIKATYPKLQVIATAGVKSRTPDVLDEHFYESPASFEKDVHHYDSYSRGGPKIFVGEWASQEGSPTPNLHAAIGDAAWLTGLERNSDIVIMESYAPLFVNTNPGASQWATNLIGYDALQSYGSPAYYVQVMFADNHGDVALPVTLNSSGGSSVYASVTRNSKSGALYVKVVNAAFEPQQVNFSLTGFNSIAPNGSAVLLTGNPAATNAPGKIQAVPETVAVKGLGANFSQSFPAYSVTVLKISAK